MSVPYNHPRRRIEVWNTSDGAKVSGMGLIRIRIGGAMCCLGLSCGTVPRPSMSCRVGPSANGTTLHQPSFNATSVCHVSRKTPRRHLERPSPLARLLRLLYSECGQVIAFPLFQFAIGFLSCSLIAASKRYSSHQQPGTFRPPIPTHRCTYSRIRCRGLPICELGLPLRFLARARSTRPNFETRLLAPHT
jgi:hypothetical protein